MTEYKLLRAFKPELDRILGDWTLISSTSEGMYFEAFTVASANFILTASNGGRDGQYVGFLPLDSTAYVSPTLDVGKMQMIILDDHPLGDFGQQLHWLENHFTLICYWTRPQVYSYLSAEISKANKLIGIFLDEILYNRLSSRNDRIHRSDEILRDYLRVAKEPLKPIWHRIARYVCVILDPNFYVVATTTERRKSTLILQDKRIQVKIEVSSARELVLTRPAMPIADHESWYEVRRLATTHIRNRPHSTLEDQLSMIRDYLSYFRRLKPEQVTEANCRLDELAKIWRNLRDFALNPEFS